ncbi:aldo/keto reductase [Vibrio sp. TH_r3]|uniref:aldo/keto reductase n=1 Tax=Vibrio sp. TH_r3 TaxID=3082084 RepID=UPI002955263A|nr:aldo/keto reductase [Vibrio sp. TH_r3]MDV7105093.1 aldo/keto reductase [Vibrio sp. TH_r3]
MEFKKIADLEVSVLGFGCWALGGTWNNINDRDSIDSIHRAIDVGTNFFDIAPIYGKGHSEIVMGKALKNISRDKVVIATKCGLPWEPQTRKSRKDLSASSIFKEIDDSLSRLGLDYVDLYQVHWPDPNTPIQETAEALKEIQKQGKIRHIGVSNYSLDMTREMMNVVDVVSFQGLYNLIEQNPESYHNIPLEYRSRSEVLPFCKDNNMKYIPYSPLMQGLLTGTFKPQNNFNENDDRSANPKLNGDTFKQYYECAQELKILATQHGVSLAHLAIQWLVMQENVGPVIVGAHHPSHVEHNAQFIGKRLAIEVLLEADNIVAKFGLS